MAHCIESPNKCSFCVYTYVCCLTKKYILKCFCSEFCIEDAWFELVFIFSNKKFTKLVIPSIKLMKKVQMWMRTCMSIRRLHFVKHRNRFRSTKTCCTQHAKSFNLHFGFCYNEERTCTTTTATKQKITEKNCSAENNCSVLFLSHFIYPCEWRSFMNHEMHFM